MQTTADRPTLLSAEGSNNTASRHSRHIGSGRTRVYNEALATAEGSQECRAAGKFFSAIRVLQNDSKSSVDRHGTSCAFDARVRFFDKSYDH